MELLQAINWLGGSNAVDFFGHVQAEFTKTLKVTLQPAKLLFTTLYQFPRLLAYTISFFPDLDSTQSTSLRPLGLQAN